MRQQLKELSNPLNGGLDFEFVFIRIESATLNPPWY